ncbi:MAG: hypothetical protein WBW44_06295, partial [Solirubrobacterales bacterium]
MSDLNEFADLAEALEANRPQPSAGFTEKLDTAVADHFPKEWSADSWGNSRTGFFDPARHRLANLFENMLPAAAGLATVLLVVVAVGVGLNQGGSSTSDDTSPDFSAQSTSDSASSTAASPQESGEGPTFSDKVPVPTGISQDESSVGRAIGNVGPNAAGVKNRKVAQDVEITLGTNPDELQGVSNEIIK